MLVVLRDNVGDIGMVEIYHKILELVNRKYPVALLVVASATGSTPQSVGAKALVNSQGKLLAGTIGGGLMESKALSAGADVLQGGIAQLFDFALDEPYSREAGPICGGNMRIFAVPCQQTHCQIYRLAIQAIESRQKGLILTHLTGSDIGHITWLDANRVGEANSPVNPTQLRSFITQQQAATITDHQAGIEILVEPISALPRMLIVGGGHVGQAITQQAIWLGFDVTVLDDRTEFARADRFPHGTKVICGPICDVVERLPKESDSFIVIVSKGHKPDAEALEGCIHSDPAYIGMIGSQRKIALLRKHFLESGLATEQEFAHVFAPIGLDIGAVTVEEIATSIMAQIVAIRRQQPETAQINHMVMQ